MRSLPDIYRAPHIQLHIADAVAIPDAPLELEDPDVLEEEEAAELGLYRGELFDAGDPEDDEEGLPEDQYGEGSDAGGWDLAERIGLADRQGLAGVGRRPGEEWREGDGDDGDGEDSRDGVEGRDGAGPAEYGERDGTGEDDGESGDGLWSGGYGQDGRIERRKSDRRQNGRRSGDNESIESLSRQYRARLGQTREEIIAEIGPGIQNELRKQLKEHQESLKKSLAEQEEEMQRQKDEYQAELSRQLYEAREQAYLTELNAKKAQLQEALDGLEQGIQYIENSYGAFVQEFTDELKYMALEIAERILRKEIDENIHGLDALAAQLVSEIKNATWINVEVTDQIEGLAAHMRDQLARAEQGKSIIVEEKDGPPDTLRVVTEEGVVDATLSVQIRQLREAFARAEADKDA